MKSGSHFFFFVERSFRFESALLPFQAGYVNIFYIVVSCVENLGNIVSVCGVFSSPWLRVCKS